MSDELDFTAGNDVPASIPVQPDAAGTPVKKRRGRPPKKRPETAPEIDEDRSPVPPAAEQQPLFSETASEPPAPAAAPVFQADAAGDTADDVDSQHGRERADFQPRRQNQNELHQRAKKVIGDGHSVEQQGDCHRMEHAGDS